MKCHVCGGEMSESHSDMPFKLAPTRTVIIKDLPVLLCSECGEYTFTDKVMAKVEEALAKVNSSAELEIVRFAA